MRNYSHECYQQDLKTVAFLDKHVADAIADDKVPINTGNWTYLNLDDDGWYNLFWEDLRRFSSISSKYDIEQRIAMYEETYKVKSKDTPNEKI